MILSLFSARGVHIKQCYSWVKYATLKHIELISSDL